uniref:Uncharacterized protein n=1 Tax=Tanacetum cinerariifolium TaxID=118510 RepID=A0A6L2KBG2_TANCI|nr:hypothetical protein [Tanacetum cinerariifolium]
MNYYEPNPCYDSNYFGFDQFQPSQSVIDHLNLQQRINDSMIELREAFQAWLQQRQDQVVNLDSYSPEPSQYRKIPIYYDDDDDEKSYTPLRDIIIFELPPYIAITPVFSTEEPRDSLIMGDKHLNTISEKESDKFIKSKYSSIIFSSKIDSLLDEFLGELIFLKSIPPGIDEADCDPEEEIHLIEKLLLMLLGITYYCWVNVNAVEDLQLADEESVDCLLNSTIFEQLALMSPKTTAWMKGTFLPWKFHLLSHQGFKAFQLSSESPMMIYEGNIPTLEVPFLHFYPP